MVIPIKIFVFPLPYYYHEWVRLAEAAGMQYIVFTTKHYADVVRKLFTEANGKNTNVLLKIGPQPDGRFPAPAIAVLKELAKN